MRTFEEGGSICRIISCVDNDCIYYKIETGNDTAHFSDLSEEEQKIVLEWLQWNVWLAKNKLDVQDQKEFSDFSATGRWQTGHADARQS